MGGQKNQGIYFTGKEKKFLDYFLFFIIVRQNQCSQIDIFMMI